jgi:2-oxoisovalerate dehydrogenase E2 component (dihydrolipoyl transacylase)
VARVVMPQLGESVAEGTIGKWLKQPGDTVAKDEPLLEVITDKVNAEVPSPFSGILKQILVEEGATVPHDAEIAEIDEVGGNGAETPAVGAKAETPATAGPAAAPSAAAAAAHTAAPVSAASAAAHAEAAAQPGRPLVPVMETPAERPVAAPMPNGGRGDPNARMTPAVRMLMREHNLVPEQIVGTGHGGRVTRDDVLRFVEQARGAASGTAVSAGAPTPSAQPAPAGPSSADRPAVVWEPGQDEVLVPLNQMRRGIANQMTRAAAVPVAYSTFEADMTAVANLRAAQADAYKAREGIGLSYLPFVVKAVVEALHGNPDLNAHYSDEGLLRKRRINVGIAIAVENGLIVPVIKDADQLSINGINRAVQDLASRARSNRLRLDDLQGGTFTIDNTGWFGSQLTVPILNVPEVCILTTEAVTKRPVVRETPEGDVIAIRSMMNLVAGYDHRVTDGAQVGRFVRDVVCWLEAVGPDMPIY